MIVSVAEINFRSSQVAWRFGVGRWDFSVKRDWVEEIAWRRGSQQDTVSSPQETTVWWKNQWTEPTSPIWWNPKYDQCRQSFTLAYGRWVPNSDSRSWDSIPDWRIPQSLFFLDKEDKCEGCTFPMQNLGDLRCYSVVNIE